MYLLSQGVAAAQARPLHPAHAPARKHECRFSCCAVFHAENPCCAAYNRGVVHKKKIRVKCSIYRSACWKVFRGIIGENPRCDEMRERFSDSQLFLQVCKKFVAFYFRCWERNGVKITVEIKRLLWFS